MTSRYRQHGNADVGLELIGTDGQARQISEHFEDLANGATPWIGAAVGGASGYIYATGSGAKGDGTTDDTAALTAAIAAANAAGLPLFLPTGTYRVSSTISLTSSLTIIGESRSSVRIKVLGAGYSIFTDGAALDHVIIRGIDLVGYHEESAVESSAAILVNLSQTSYFEMLNAGVVRSQSVGVKVKAAAQVYMSGCYVREIARGGVNFSGCGKVIIQGNVFAHVYDDPISLHTEPTGADPIQGFHVVSGNLFHDTQGVTCLGGRVVTVANNNFLLCHGRAIWVGLYDSTFNEGASPPIGCTVSNNTIVDQLAGAVYDNTVTLAECIRIGGLGPYLGSGDDAIGGAPGYFDATNGGIVSPYDHYWQMGTTLPTPGACYFTIADNKMVRTRGAATNYSDWGFGQPFFKTGGYFDPAVTDANLNIDGIVIYGGLKDAILRGNIYCHGKRGVYFQVLDATNDRWKDIILEGNILKDCLSGCISTNAAAAIDARVIIRHNVLNGDPFHRHASRSTDGSWAAVGNLNAINLPFFQGLAIYGNRVLNCSRFTNVGGAALLQAVVPNMLFCDPVADGFSTSNRGMGQVDQASAMVQYQITYSDPRTTANGGDDTNYGKPKRTGSLESGSQPSTGTYVKGEFVRRTTVPSGADNATWLSGWWRMTTGTSHTKGTDWAGYQVTLDMS